MKTDPDKEVAAEPKDPAGAAMERSNLYGFLAAIFRREPTAALLRQIRKRHFLESLSAAGVALDRDLFERPEGELLEELAVEYTQLFIGPGNHVAPYASVHLGGDGTSLWGESTAWVKAFIASAGFEYRPDYHDLPDHLGVELEFMQQVTAREARALDEADRDTVVHCRRIEDEFVGDHLAKWIPAFCKKVAARAELPFYREMAGLAESFMRSEVQELASRKS